MNNTGAPEPTSPRNPKQDTAAWKAIVLKFQEPSLPRAIWQLVNTLGPLWGQHLVDVNAQLGNLVADVGLQSAGYLLTH